MNIEVNVYRDEVEELKYSSMHTPANNSFNIIFRGEHYQVQNNRLEHGNTDELICLHTHV